MMSLLGVVTCSIEYLTLMIRLKTLMQEDGETLLFCLVMSHSLIDKAHLNILGIYLLQEYTTSLFTLNGNKSLTVENVFYFKPTISNLF